MFGIKGITVVLTFVVVAASHPGVISLHEVETPEDKEIEPITTSPSPISRFRLGFTAYEKRVRIFIENMRREFFTMNTDSVKFLNELDTYLDQLTVNRTKLVSKKYRSRCYCEGQTWTPCPERCMYSCYVRKGFSWIQSDNCNGISSSSCYCYEGSSTRCDKDALENCFEEKLELIEEPKPCSNFATDRSIVKESFSRFSDLLVEPLKILVRGLEFKLTSFKQSVIATDLLSEASSQICDENYSNCIPEAAALLSQKLSYFRQLKKNITLDMIKTQNKAEAVAKDVDDLKEQTFNQISQSIKEYSCCLRGLKFEVKDNVCAPTPNVTEISATTTESISVSGRQPGWFNHLFEQACPYPNFFLCDNQGCISGNDRCDGSDGCGDNSDEEGC